MTVSIENHVQSSYYHADNLAGIPISNFTYEDSHMKDKMFKYLTETNFLGLTVRNALRMPFIISMHSYYPVIVEC